VTITYEDASTNANFNGITTGTNLAKGNYSFSLIGHTTYSISVFKVGSGAPNVIGSVGRSNARGVDVNKSPTSPYFGRVYSVNGNAAFS